MKATAHDLVSYERVGSVARIRLDDGKVNVISVSMQQQLHAALDRATKEEVAVIIRGRSSVFSAGFDLEVMKDAGPAKYEMVIGGLRIAERIFSFPLPVVMECSGHAIAMGFFLLISSDYRIGAGGQYRVVANEVAQGMSAPRAAIELMRHRMTPCAFDRAAALAIPFSSDEAVLSGVFDQVASSEQLEEAAQREAERLSELDLTAHRTTKLRVRARATAALRVALDADDGELRERFGLGR